MDKQILSFGSNFEPYIETHKILPIETENNNKGLINWGLDNGYPNYLYELYDNVTTLRTVINTITDYVCGDNCSNEGQPINNLEDIIYDCALSYAIYGGFAIQVYRNKLGEVVKLECLDMRWIRSDKKNNFIYYSEDFGIKQWGRCKAITYPKFDVNNKVPVSVYLYKNEKGCTYPKPVHLAAVPACEIERNINDYHLNSINNGFSGSLLVNMNNGVPEEEQQNEIVNGFNEKFSGHQNAGRVVVTFNNSKDNATELIPLNPTDFGDKYNAAVERASQQIFASWRVTPNLCGMPTETTGFNSQEYSSAFKLLQRTVIRPIQKQIIKSIETCYENKVKVNIDPYTIDFEENTVEDTKNISTEE